MLKRITTVTVSLLLLLSCLVQSAYAQGGETTSALNSAVDEVYDARLLEFYQTIMDETFKFFGFYEMGMTVTLNPDALALYPTFDEFYESLKQMVEYLLPMLEKERLSAEPNHDPSIVVFPKEAQISVFIGSEPLDFGELEPYAIRVRNHDEVMFPAEMLLTALGIEYEWEPEDEILTVTTQGYFEGANPNVYTFGLDYYAVNGTEYPKFVQLFDIIDGCPYLSNKMIGDFAYDTYKTVIYHNLSKVVFVPVEMLSQNYLRAITELSIQCERADYPLYDPVTVMVDGVKMEYKETQPFVVNTTLDDYSYLHLQTTKRMVE